LICAKEYIDTPNAAITAAVFFIAFIVQFLGLKNIFPSQTVLTVMHAFKILMILWGYSIGLLKDHLICGRFNFRKEKFCHTYVNCGCT
jgi:hypothetical protein